MSTDDDHDHDHERSWDWTQPAVAVRIAEGILMERYQIPASAASNLLRSCAATAELAVADVAVRLITTGYLPQTV